MTLILNDELKKYVWAFSDKAQEESTIFPVDRAFVEPHLTKIKSFDPITFLYYNFEMINDTYVNQLFACLPEIWIGVNLDDLITISRNFTNVHSYFTMIKFTYKVIGIDIIENILSIANANNAFYVTEIARYLSCQWMNLLYSKEELNDFQDGFIEVDQKMWHRIKQEFLSDHRVKPALSSYQELEMFIKNTVESISLKYDR